MPPLILTLQLDADAQARFQTERQRYFPPERNQIPAHLTLFHQLPEGEATLRTLAQIAQDQSAFPLDVTGLRSLGRGVAYRLASADLRNLHARLAEIFSDHLIPQDRQAFHPHVVVQNKTDPATARSTLAELTSRFKPFSIRALGLDLWLYCNGPWQFLQTFAFPSGRNDAQG